MHLTLNKQSALFVMRKLRLSADGRRVLKKRCGLSDPDCSPRKRWTRGLIDLSRFGIPHPYPKERELHVAVVDGSARLRLGNVKNTIYGKGLPSDSFIEVGNGLRVSSPELLFAELAAELPLAQAVMLGNELCGSFSRDADDPTGGQVKMGLPALTNKLRLQEFLECAKHIRKMHRAKRVLEFVEDNAWSPTEAALATVAALPVEEFGYGLGSYSFNVRISSSEVVRRTGAKGSRVPDIMFENSGVGLNYDGAVHLNLEAIAEAATEVTANPGAWESAEALECAMHDTRAKVVDDIKRNRELLASGLAVFPVVKEDVYEKGALDALMVQVMEAIERFDGRDLSEQKAFVSSPLVADKRYKLIRSLLPGSGYPSGVVWGDGMAEEGNVVEMFVGI